MTNILILQKVEWHKLCTKKATNSVAVKMVTKLSVEQMLSTQYLKKLYPIRKAITEKII